jgi:hypothetical protein
LKQPSLFPAPPHAPRLPNAKRDTRAHDAANREAAQIILTDAITIKYAGLPTEWAKLNLEKSR